MRQDRRSPSKPAIALPRTLHAAALVATLILALVFGGGGTPAELAELVVQLGCLAIAAALVLASPPHRLAPMDIYRRDRAIALLWLALILLCLVQLIPLPPSLWQGLPGRAAIVENAKAFDSAPWLAFSIDPARTVA